MGAFTAFFDAAGTEKEKDVLVACGVIGYQDKWDKFDEDRIAVLQCGELFEFHMKSFAHFKAPFDHGWRESPERRTAFLDLLLRQISRTAIRVYVTTLDLRDYEIVNRDFMMREQFATPYAWAMSNCLLKVESWLGRERPDPIADAPPHDARKYLVEKGDIGQEQLRPLLMRAGWSAELFDTLVHLTSKKIGHEDMTPFHAPDFIAYEYRSEHRYFVENGATKAKRRGALTAIKNRLSPYVGIVTEREMRQACIMNNVARRQ